MTEKLKELLEKINEEGVKAAEDKAKVIESKAKEDAGRILRDAKREADEIIKKAKALSEKSKTDTEKALKQASRDLILSLKNEIKKIFDKIIAEETAKALSEREMAQILGNLIEGYIEKDGKVNDIKVLLKKDDLEKLKASFSSRLKERVKEGLEFKASPNIKAGFSVSFDKGKSFFDVTDEGLSEALCAYLNPELGKMLEG